MKCKQLKKVEQYHDGDLSNQEADFIKSHMEGCPDCREYLKSLHAQERVLSHMKTFQPVLENPKAFKQEVLKQIENQKRRSAREEINKIGDTIMYILLQPVTKFSFAAAAIVIFGVFIYQQMVIVQKIGSLEKRMESNVAPTDTRISSLKYLETYFKKRPGGKSEYNELLEDYWLLQIQHKVLLKALKNKYPDVYQDIVKELEKAELLPANINS